MKVVATALPGVLILEPDVFRDERGFFVETFRESWLDEAGICHSFVQENQSRSRRGVLRGLHYQTRRPQAKLVRVSRGTIFDVAVDVRRGSPTFGRWTGVMLDDRTHRQLYLPCGFAHGFCILSEEADFNYKCSDYYDPQGEAGVRWDDHGIGIQWPAIEHGWILSDKDRAWPGLAEQKELPELP